MTAVAILDNRNPSKGGARSMRRIVNVYVTTRSDIPNLTLDHPSGVDAGPSSVCQPLKPTLPDVALPQAAPAGAKTYWSLSGPSSASSG
jgi:hypothetical protein